MTQMPRTSVLFRAKTMIVMLDVTDRPLDGARVTCLPSERAEEVAWRS
jgi:hypothetical protein